MKALLVVAALWGLAASEAFTFAVSQCFNGYPASLQRARMMSARPFLVLRASNLRCWGTDRLPGPGDDVLVDFAEESASGVSSFVVDQPVVWQSLTIRRARRKRHSSVIVAASLTVQNRITVPKLVIVHLNATVTAGSFVLESRAVLSGDGLLTTGSFETEQGSFVSPGRLFVSMCGGMCYQMPRRLQGAGHGALRIVVTEAADADLSGATVLLKAIGTHPSFGNRTFDLLAVNRATLPARTMLMLGSAVLRPGNVSSSSSSSSSSVFSAESYPPVEALCVASGLAGAAYSPRTDECLSFAVEHGLTTMKQWPDGVDAAQQWKWLRPEIISSALNKVPFALPACCRRAMRAVLREAPAGTTDLESQVQAVQMARIVTQMKRNRLLRYRAPRAARRMLQSIQHFAERSASSTDLSPLMSLVASESASQMAQSEADSCVPSGSILISLDAKCCPNGFTGPGCEVPVPCTCSSRGVCTTTSVCLCNPGFSGADCTTPVCPSDASGRVCGGPSSGTCTYDLDDPSDVPECTCNASFTGDACNVPVCDPPCDSERETCISRGFAPVCWDTVTDQLSCPACLNGGTCVNFTCVCTAEFEGPLCQSPVCPSRCSGNGVCYVDDRNHASCNCLPRFSGLGCETELCTPERCQNGGVCVSGPTCRCAVSFGGPFCQERVITSNRNAMFAGAALADGAMLAIIVVCSLLAGSLVVFLIVNYRLRKDAHYTAQFNAGEMARLLGQVQNTI